jgi:hypothetical protein
MTFFLHRDLGRQIHQGFIQQGLRSKDNRLNLPYNLIYDH